MKKYIILIAVTFVGCKIKHCFSFHDILGDNRMAKIDSFTYYHNKWADAIDSSLTHANKFLDYATKWDLEKERFELREEQRFDDSAHKYLKLEKQSIPK